MTNRELLERVVPKATLSHIDRQKRFLLQQAAARSTCPNCGRWCNQFEAANIDVDDWDFRGADREYHCPTCKRELIHTLPLMVGGGFPGWYWSLKPERIARRSAR